MRRIRTADSVCFCDVIARDPFFIIGREPRPDFRIADLLGIRFASVAEVPTPWLCLQDDLRRAGIDPATLNRRNGPTMAENAAALRARLAGRCAAVPALRRGTDRIGRGPCLVCRGGSRAHRLHGAGDAPPVARAARATNCCAMTRAMARTLRWMAATPGSDIARALGEFFPSVAPDIFAAAIDRYRALATVRARSGAAARRLRSAAGCDAVRRRARPSPSSSTSAWTIPSPGQVLADPRGAAIGVSPIPPRKGMQRGVRVCTVGKS